VLVSFAVSNFRSFAAKQTFSLIASARLDSTHEHHALPIPDSNERGVLRAGVIFGANGAIDEIGRSMHPLLVYSSSNTSCVAAPTAKSSPPRTTHTC
jgi:hypothetical protein